MKTRFLLLALLVLGHLASADNEIGFIERFALAPNREAVLQELLPGTEAYYFYHALEFQNTRQPEKLRSILAEWATRFPSSHQRQTLQNRQALIAYESDPKSTLDFLREHFSLSFEHRQEVRDRKPGLPTRLDPAQISRARFQAQALLSDDLREVQPTGLEDLVRENVQLRPSQQRALLARISRPDLPGLLALIETNLRSKEAKGFGEFPIHRALLIDQLDELATRVPSLYLNRVFVYARLRKLQPSADLDLQFAPRVREAWLDSLWAYAKNLSPSFNTLKAQILFLRLTHDRNRGIYDKSRILDYVKLPRTAPYVSERPSQFAIDFNADLSEALLEAPPIRNDEWLIRALLLEILKDEKSPTLFAPYLREDFLNPLFAESKIVHAGEDAQKWVALLTLTQLQTLKDRVDVDFTPSNPRLQNPAEEVNLGLELKNVPKLLVKIYELNALSYFLSNNRQLDTDLNLEGLVANAQKSYEFSQSPLRRIHQQFAFPELKGRRGAWVIEFIGGGKSSRALIRKGQWTVLQQSAAAGESLLVIDEERKPVPSAVIWFEGRKFIADEKSGRIVIPYAQEPGEKPIIVADESGQFANLTHFEHHSESYRLDVQFHLEREQILAGREATLAMRSALWIGANRISSGLLIEPRLTITSTTLDGVVTTRELPKFKLTGEALSTHSFIVPERLASLSVRFNAKVENLSRGAQPQDLVATETWNFNGIDRTELIADAHLARRGIAYIFELLGKNGEALADQPVVFNFVQRDFSLPISVTLQSDEAGRIELGELNGIAQLTASLPNSRIRSWNFAPDGARHPEVIHAKAGVPIEVPWFDRPLRREEVSLLEKRAGTFTHDYFSRLSLAHGLLQIKALPPGDFSLRLPNNQSIEISVTEGTPVGNWLVSDRRILEVRDPAPIQIDEIRAEPDAIWIHLQNPNSTARVHIAATRYLPEFDLRQLWRSFRVNPSLTIPARYPNLAISGRAIGDEFRYILERREFKLFPGNMLPRPGLILNPWEVRSTDVSAQAMAQGQLPGRSGGASRSALSTRKALAQDQINLPKSLASAASAEPDLEFLASAAPVLYNLTPDENGLVKIERKLLGDRQHVQVYAEDLTSAVYRSFALPELKAKFQDLRLARNLDPQSHFSERHQISLLQAGQNLVIPDLLTSELETYDSLASVHALFTTLNPDPKFAQFAWILQWPTLGETEKRAKYSEFACHELNFFLARKDPEFFRDVIRPYLANKKEKTFLDDWLLGNDLRHYLQTWNYSGLNMAERALLAQHLPAESAATARHLRDLLELLPPNPERQEQLFFAALRGRALQEGEADSFKAEKSKVIALEKAPETAASTVLRSAEARPMGNIAPMQMAAAPVPIPGLDEAGRANVISADELNQSEAERQRGQARQFYRKIGPTKEWAENNYYRLPLELQNASLVPINAFWADYAAWDPKTPFLSSHLAEATQNFSEMMLALAVLDLPFNAPKAQTQTQNGQFKLTASGPLVVVHQEIKSAPMAPKQSELLVSENFFRQGDREQIEGNEHLDKYVTDEFISAQVYGANVVVTNPNSAPQKLEILMQIPRGALPVLGSKATESKRLRVEPYTTQRLEYFFYFPAPATEPLPHYPVHVSRNEQTVGSAKPFAFKVVRQLSVLDKASWDHVSQYGSEADVLTYLETHNIERIDLERIAWRVRESASFFRRLLSVMEKRHLYQPVLYSYGVFHNDPAAINEWLRHQDDFVKECGPWLETKLLKIDPIERRTYQHLEYSPLINPRAHRLGAEPKIANAILRQQYQSLLEIMAYKPRLDSIDELSLVYYLFLQDRVEEALARFAAIPAAPISTKVQYDYLRCYAAFYQEQFEPARALAAEYASYPVERWRKLFLEVSAQLKEADQQKPTREPAEKNRESQQSELAQSEPSFEFKVENRTIALNWRNLDEVTINFYLMDPEFLFSRSPFVTEKPERFSIIKPSKSLRQILPAGKEQLEIALPIEFAKANVLVEVLGAGQRKTQAYHSHSFRISIAENYGRLDVRDSAQNQPISKVYVKVYARLQNGQVRFFKDGYTDLRGRFDYASLNAPENPAPPSPLPAATSKDPAASPEMLRPDELPQVERLAILLLSDKHGAAVREVNPPGQ